VKVQLKLQLNLKATHLKVPYKILMIKATDLVFYRQLRDQESHLLKRLLL